MHLSEKAQCGIPETAKENTATYREVSSDRNIYGVERVNQPNDRRAKAVHRYFQLESEKEMIEEQYHFYMGQAQMISYGAMLGKIKKAILGKDDGDTKKLLELLMDTWIDEVEDQLKENTVYQGMLEKISKYEEQVQAMGLSKEKRKTIDAYVTEVSERWILYAESLYQAGMQKILELLNL